MSTLTGVVAVADEAWLRDRAETERDGPLVAQVRNQFWKATDYSPLQ